MRSSNWRGGNLRFAVLAQWRIPFVVIYGFNLSGPVSFGLIWRFLAKAPDVPRCASNMSPVHSVGMRNRILVWFWVSECMAW